MFFPWCTAATSGMLCGICYSQIPPIYVDVVSFLAMYWTDQMVLCIVVAHLASAIAMFISLFTKVTIQGNIWDTEYTIPSMFPLRYMVQLRVFPVRYHPLNTTFHGTYFSYFGSMDSGWYSGTTPVSFYSLGLLCFPKTWGVPPRTFVYVLSAPIHLQTLGSFPYEEIIDPSSFPRSSEAFATSSLWPPSWSCQFKCALHFNGSSWSVMVLLGLLLQCFYLRLHDVCCPFL